MQKHDKKIHFDKSLVMSSEYEERFQQSNNCWICNELFDVRDDKVRGRCHVTRKYRGSAHWCCNVNLKLTKNVRVMFHNSRVYDSHLITQEINKSDVKLKVIPNRLKTFMPFTINSNLVFIENMQFRNSSLIKFVKNRSDNEFKYLSQEFSGDFLQLVKQKGVYPYEYTDSFERFSEDKLPDRFKFFSSVNK